MVRSKKLVQSVLYSLQENADLPETTQFVGYEPDINSESIKLPLVEVSLGTKLQISEMNSDFTGARLDESGNEIGKNFVSLYSQDITIAVWTAHASKYSPRELSDEVRTALYAHTTTGPRQPLLDPVDESPLDEVWRFVITEGSHTDDLATSPTLRRWEETIQVFASERYITDAEYIRSVDLETNSEETPVIQ